MSIVRWIARFFLLGQLALSVMSLLVGEYASLVVNLALAAAQWELLVLINEKARNL